VGGRPDDRRRRKKIARTNETGIRWLESPLDHRYVRVAAFHSRSPVRRPRQRKGATRVVGYSVVARAKGADRYERRMFVVHERDPWRFDGAPAEAVDPLTVAPNERGRRTERATTFAKTVVVIDP
jgi:hypothetical protein